MLTTSTPFIQLSHPWILSSLSSSSSSSSKIRFNESTQTWSDKDPMNTCGLWAQLCCAPGCCEWSALWKGVGLGGRRRGRPVNYLEEHCSMAENCSQTAQQVHITVEHASLISQFGGLVVADSVWLRLICLKLQGSTGKCVLLFNSVGMCLTWCSDCCYEGHLASGSSP